MSYPQYNGYGMSNGWPGSYPAPTPIVPQTPGRDWSGCYDGTAEPVKSAAVLLQHS